jgi:hypothetical protein
MELVCLMVLGLELRDDGTSHEVDLNKEDLKSHKVYCLIDRENKSIHLWTGRRANVRQRFIAALTASRIRTQFGLDFRVKPLLQGEEYPAFLDVFRGNLSKILSNAK